MTALLVQAAAMSPCLRTERQYCGAHREYLSIINLPCHMFSEADIATVIAKFNRLKFCQLSRLLSFHLVA